ncbi:hypothetical protein [Mycobacterium sp.]|nr:hypothetical protein [Mycobacterium sp.]
MNKYCVIFGRRSLAVAMRNQVEPSRSDGLFAAGALWVGGHGFSLPWPHHLGHHSPRILQLASRLSATSPSLRLVQWRHALGCRRRCADDGIGPDHAILRASSVVQVTSLTVTVPETVDVKELESEIVTAVADRLRDDHGYELVAEAGAGGSETRNEHLLHPAGSIVVDSKPGALKGKLHGVKVDAHDLFTGVSSELEQRHEGLRVEIG